MSEMTDLLEEIRDKLDELVREVRELNKEHSWTNRTSFAGQILSHLSGIETAINFINSSKGR